MAENEFEALQEELEHYKNEKQKIREAIGQIGGRRSKKHDTAINIIFLVLVVTFFAFDLTRHFMGWGAQILPPMILLEIAVLLVSLKIIWMIHTQTKVDHFQFWILNSIEFRINQMTRRLENMEKMVQASLTENADKKKQVAAEPVE